jgi:5-(carboxyamino)imidazole ribonucleotide synthase
LANFGYDGKGQVVCQSIDEVYTAFDSLNQAECVLEQRINLDKEISTVLARSQDGTVTFFPVAENVHVNGILHSTTVPSSVDSRLTDKAIEMAQTISSGLNYVGTMAVEFFVSKEGDVIANEIAPRPHNSGHYTLDACTTCQFEQQVRMLCGLPAGDANLILPVVMINLLGDVWGSSQPNWAALLKEPNVKLHLYGKKEARVGRKMGHYNVLSTDTASASALAETIFSQLQAD